MLTELWDWCQIDNNIRQKISIVECILILFEKQIRLLCKEVVPLVLRIEKVIRIFPESSNARKIGFCKSRLFSRV